MKEKMNSKECKAMPSKKPRLKHNLVWVVFGTLLLPGILAILVSLCGPRVILKWMKSDYALGGKTQPLTTPVFDLAHIKSHAVQKYVEEWLPRHLPLYSLFIRLNNQIYYSIFKKSYADNSRLIVGKSNQLFEMIYINSYCNRLDMPFRHKENLREWANKLKIISDFFEKQGKTFVFVITPSKAEYMPEAIPHRWHCQDAGLSAHIKEMEKLLTERKIRFVNGSTLMKQATQQYQLAMFPRGGIHWNMLGASIETNAIIDVINRDGHIHLQPLHFDYTMQNEAHGQDKDLMWLLNLLRPDYHYPVPKVIYKNSPITAQHLSAALIGGSFLEKIVDIFTENKTFSKLSYYRYFKLDRTEYTPGKPSIKNEIQVESGKDLAPILTADVVILEENAAGSITQHAELFYNVMNQFAFSNRQKHMDVHG